MTRNRWTWPVLTMVALAPLSIGAGLAAGEAIDQARLTTVEPQADPQVTSTSNLPTPKAGVLTERVPLTSRATPQGDASQATPTRAPSGRKATPTAGPDAVAGAPAPQETPDPLPTTEPTTEPPVYVTPTRAPTCGGTGCRTPDAP